MTSYAVYIERTGSREQPTDVVIGRRRFLHVGAHIDAQSCGEAYNLLRRRWFYTPDARFHVQPIR